MTLPISENYKHGWSTDISADSFQAGLSADIVRALSAKKEEPKWLLDMRLQAFATWKNMEEPHWADFDYAPLDYQALSYYSAPKAPAKYKSLDEIDPALRRTYERLGIPLQEQEILAGVAVDAVFDSVSVITTYKEKLAEYGVVFCPISEAVRLHPELVKRYLCSVVPHTDNFFSALNTAVFSDGSFVFIPKGVRCPIELSTYFRINARNTGQFERTLIIADEESYVSYLEGCTAPQRDQHQLHAAVVEIVVMDNAQVKYSTVQNWYPGDKDGAGGVLNFVTKRGLCKGRNSKLSWTQVETGSAMTWKYPSCILAGHGAVGEFYSVAVTNNHQHADTGTKMIHLAPDTRSTIISKGISAGHSSNAYRGLVKMAPAAAGGRNYTRCDSMIIGDNARANTFPVNENMCSEAMIEHEASTAKISQQQLFYCASRGISEEQAVSLIVNGFCKEVMQKLPLEFSAEASRLIGLSIENPIG